MLKKLKKAFTITELVIVIAVIAILAAVLIPTFANVIESANQSAALQSCRNALSDYQGVLANKGDTTAAMENMVFESKGYAYVYKNGALQYIGKVKNLDYVSAADNNLTKSWVSTAPDIKGISITGTGTASMEVTSGPDSTLKFVPGTTTGDDVGLAADTVTTVEGVTKDKQVERVFMYTVKINETAYAGWFTLEVTSSMGADSKVKAAYSIESAGANYSRVAYCVPIPEDTLEPISITFAE